MKPDEDKARPNSKMESTVRELSEIVEETIDQDGQEGTEIQYSSWDMVEYTWDEHHSKSMRACLQFCYLFPQDYEFPKNDLILLWIAEELLSVAQNETLTYSELVDRGCLYFDEFEEMNIFLLSSLDHSTHSQRYKLNKSVFHLLQQHHDDAYSRVDDTKSYAPDSTLHSSIYDSSIDAITLEKLYHAKRLCTLLILHESGSKLDQVPREVFLKLPWIGVLDLSGTNIKEVPSSIGKLKQLRYLNLSGTPIARLPESVCSLYQMRILKLKGCLKLVSLPNGMRRLVRLQYLDVDVARLLVSMPPGFGDLTDLNHLPAFVVGKENGCCITELKEMMNLHGTLRILRLENVSSLKEAADATLDGKKHIVKLQLQWTEFNDGIQFEVLQNLRPHTQIEELQIVGFAGLEFPSWIGDPQFSKLVKVTLHDCRKCKRLPPLGKLPFLKHLCISDMLAVQVIDTLFCGRDMVGGLLGFRWLVIKATTQFKYSNMFLAFPSLENLTLNGMPALEKWIRIEKGDFHHLQKLSITCCHKLTSLPEISFLVSLQQLEISLCTSLKSLPNKGLPISLQWLIIMECPLLKEWCLKEAKLERGKLAGIPNIWIDDLHISLGQSIVRDSLTDTDKEMKFEKVAEPMAAAVKIQNIYRSYQTRRRLADSVVVAEELWLQVSRSNYVTGSFLKSEDHTTRGNLINRDASIVGKAKQLSFQYWIEAIDPRHRYGHNLHMYYEVWANSPSVQPFFYWLDIGDGRDVDLEDCPRPKLREQCIKYLGPQERDHYEYIVVDGKFLHKQSGELLDTTKGYRDSEYIFVMSTFMKLYAGEKKKGVFNHSSFLAGGALVVAGRLVVVDGTLKSISAEHYHPTDNRSNFRAVYTFVDFLKENGVNFDEVEVCVSPADFEYGGDVKLNPGKSARAAPPEPTEFFDVRHELTFGNFQTSRAEGPVLERIDSKMKVGSYQLGHLSSKWSSGAGPRINCIADYPPELRVQALERVGLDPKPSPAQPNPSVRKARKLGPHQIKGLGRPDPTQIQPPTSRYGYDLSRYRVGFKSSNIDPFN